MILILKKRFFFGGNLKKIYHLEKYKASCRSLLINQENCNMNLNKKSCVTIV